MGGNIVPMLTAQGGAQVYDFQSNQVPGEEPGAERYWRDVGTIDSYFEAHMDLCDVVPAFNLYNERWPILTHIPSHPPAKFVHDDRDAKRVFLILVVHRFLLIWILLFSKGS